jgi:hypothetical protein
MKVLGKGIFLNYLYSDIFVSANAGCDNYFVLYLKSGVFYTDPLRSKAIFSYVFIFCGQYYIFVSCTIHIFVFCTSKQDVWCVCEVFFVVLYCLK